jgi:mono/diheme cytochrome c family protein
MDYFQSARQCRGGTFWSSPSTAQRHHPANPALSLHQSASFRRLDRSEQRRELHGRRLVSLSADADALYNPLSYVSFYTNGVLLGTVSNAPYALTDTGLAAGSYTLTAATDGSGLSATSAPVNITVTAGQRPSLRPDQSRTLAGLLTNMPGPTPAPCRRCLSQTGALPTRPPRPRRRFDSLRAQHPLFSDNAVKSRYLAVPNNGAPFRLPANRLCAHRHNGLSRPAPSLSRTLIGGQSRATPTSLARLETRLLVRDTNGAVYGVTYKWRPTTATPICLTNSLTEAIPFTNATGVSPTLVLSQSGDCLTCHTAVANYVLGVNARQLNGTNTYPHGVTDNQLRTLNRLGLFNPAIDEAAITNFEQLSSVTNPASLVQRARSYLDANCAQCHQPGGTGITFDARYDTPLTNQNIINARPRFPGLRQRQDHRHAQRRLALVPLRPDEHGQPGHQDAAAGAQSD